jgi:hypothetical protein
VSAGKSVLSLCFGGIFSYDKEAPYHCWLPKTAAKHRASESLIDKENFGLEPKLQEA